MFEHVVCRESTLSDLLFRGVCLTNELTGARKAHPKRWDVSASTLNLQLGCGAKARCRILLDKKFLACWADKFILKKAPVAFLAVAINKSMRFAEMAIMTWQSHVISFG